VTARTLDLPTVSRCLAYVDSIRPTEFGHSPNEKMMIALSDEVLRLRREVKNANARRSTSKRSNPPPPNTGKPPPPPAPPKGKP
jgi:hypothetical protein